MNPELQIDPELLEQTRQRIRNLLERVASLAREERARTDFFQDFLRLTIEGLDARGGAVWVRNGEGFLEVSAHRNFPSAELPKNSANAARHERLLELVLADGEAALILPNAGVSRTTEQDPFDFAHKEQLASDADGNAEEAAAKVSASQRRVNDLGSVQINEAGNPTDSLLLVAPFRNSEQTLGLIELFQSADASPATQHGYLRLLVQLCELANDFLKADALREAREKQVLWSALDAFTRTLHAGLDVRSTAYALVNDGRRLIGADRVTVLVQRGQRCQVEAISGQDVFDRRAKTVRLLSRLTEVVLKTGEALWFSGDSSDLPPQIEQALQAYVDVSESRTLGILPLRRPAPPPKAGSIETRTQPPPPPLLGAVVVEQIDERRPRPGLVERSELVRDHGALALANALEHRNLFLLPLWKFLGKMRAVVAFRSLPRAIAVGTAVGILLAVLLFVPAEFTLEGRGTLEPIVQQHVFARTAGIVDRLHVEHGSRVAPNSLLAEMRNVELDVELTTLRGQRAATLERFNAVKVAALEGKTKTDVERDRLHGEEEQLQKELASLDQQIGLVERKLERLRVLSPIAGEVITWDVRELLIQRPVERGQTLLTVADPKGPWRLEVRMAEERMGHVVRARQERGPDLPVEFILATNPDVTYRGTVQSIHDRAEVHGNEGNQVLIKVAINKDELSSARPGATVLAKVHCGRRSLGYVWFHEVIEFVQSRILFRL